MKLCSKDDNSQLDDIGSLLLLKLKNEANSTRSMYVFFDNALDYKSYKFSNKFVGNNFQDQIGSLGSTVCSYPISIRAGWDHLPGERLVGRVGRLLLPGFHSGGSG